jgi:hypothetical protein
MAKGDDRAVVGASGKPEKGMVLESGAKDVAKAIGGKDAATRLPNGRFAQGRRGVTFKF